MTVIHEFVELDSDVPVAFMYCDEPNCHEMAAGDDMYFAYNHRCRPLVELPNRYVADCGCAFCQTMLTLIDTEQSL